MCGIFGIINFKKKTLDKRIFNVLGINNDTRGGDSCGIFIDGKVEYGTDKLKLYSNFYHTSKLLKETKKSLIALGHCRKASVGGAKAELAQPCVIYNKENPNKIDFVVIHNGTILNYKELAQKYIPNINITGMSDSQVMTLIFYHTGYDVLGEYFGGAVFVIVDYRGDAPQIYIWKGASKHYENSPDTAVTDERPFYFTRVGKSFIFSSISSYLEGISGKECFTITPNILISVKSKNIYAEVEYNRSNCYQTKPAAASVGTYYGNYYNNTNPYADYYDDYGYYNSKSNTKSNSVTTRYYGDIKFDDGIYVINKTNTPVTGKYNISSWGYTTIGSSFTPELWFWDGILLYNEKCYKFLEKISDAFGIQVEEMKWCFSSLLNFLSPYPIDNSDYAPIDEVPDTMFDTPCIRSYDGATFSYFNGSCHHYLDDTEYKYEEGYLASTIVTDKLSTSAIKETLKQGDNIDFDRLNKLYLEEDNND